MASTTRSGLVVLGAGSLLLPLTIVPVTPAAAEPETWDLAPGATAAASSHQDDQDGYFPPSNAVDGNPTTRWSSENGPDEDVDYIQWLQFDLGQAAEVSGLTLEWEAAHAVAYTVEVATEDPADGGAWREVHTETEGSGGTEEITFSAEDARWIRLLMTERVSFDWEAPILHWYGYSLYEVNIWGTTELPTLGFARSSTVVDPGESVTVPVRLSAPSDTEITVRAATTDDTAEAGVHYTAFDGVLTFPAGSTEQEVTVETLDGGTLTQDRRFTIVLDEVSDDALLSGRDTHTVTLRARAEVPTGNRVLIDDFEDGLGGIFSWGDGDANSPDLSIIDSTRPEGGSALQAAVPGMTSWSGFSHDYTNPADWTRAAAFAFWFLGTGDGGDLRFELKSGDNSAGNATIFEHTVVDDVEGWREIVVPFAGLREKESESSDERFDPADVWGYAVTLTDLGAGTWVFDDFAIVENTYMLMDFEGEVPFTTDQDPVGVFTWAGDDDSHPSLGVIEDDRGGTAPESNHVLAGDYQITSWGGISHNLAAPQDWSGFGGIRFWWYASQDTRPASPTAGAQINVEIKDGGPDGESSELWITSFLDNWSPDGSRWKLVEIPFSQFELRTDHQAGSGDTLDGELTLDEAWGYAFTLPVGTDTPVGYRIDDVELYGSAEAVSAATVAPTPQTVLVDGGEDAVVTIAATTRGGDPLPGDIEIAWSLAEGTAEEGVDFMSDSGTLSFAAGDESGSTQEIVVPTTARDGELGARTIAVELETADARVTGPAQVTINAQEMPYLDSSLPIAERVADLLDRMTIEEKVGQMTQAERLGLSSPSGVTDYLLGSVLSGGGSVPANNTPAGWADMVDGYQAAALSTRLQIPIIYGVDAVHGHSNMIGATIFPHNIGLGASRDAGHILAQGRVTAVEVRASGIPWTFAPTLAVTLDERWGRSYESFGEDPALVALFANAAVVGLQGTDPTTFDTAAEVLATAKHWLGDGSTAYEPETPGYPIDQGISYYRDAQDLWDTDVVPYLPALEAGVGSIMPSYSAVSVDGSEPIRMHEHGELNTGLLKDELGFEGFLISDWEGINKLPGGTYAEKSVRSVNSGMDMAMAPYDYTQFISAILAAVESGDVTIDRVDDAVTRILTQKFALGLFDSPFADRSVTENVGTAEHRAIARSAAADSQVLLTNDGVLPLAADANVYVAGSTADDLGRQMGGWTISWQGGSGRTTEGTTIGEAIAAATSGNVTISPDASAPMEGHDVAVVVVGEPPYAEGVGDVGENGFTLELRANDRATIDAVCGELDCVVLVVSGRPQITSELSGVNALVASWLPGSEGDGVADVLFGERPFIGRLPVTWPAAAEQVPINVGDADYAPEFAFGWGLRTDAPQERLQALAASLSGGEAQQAIQRAASAEYWQNPSSESASEVLGLLQRAAGFLRADFGSANLAVSAARDIVQSVIVTAPVGFTVSDRHASLTSDAEHVLLSGGAGAAVRLLAEAIGVELDADDDVPPDGGGGPGNGNGSGGGGDGSGGESGDDGSATDGSGGGGDETAPTGVDVAGLALAMTVTLALGVVALTWSRRRQA